MRELTPAEQMLYSTVKVTTFKSGSLTGTGTGFFYKIAVGDDRYSMVLVTNKHVLEGADEVALLLHCGTGKAEEGPTGEVISCRVTIGPQGPACHPQADVDLCALALNELLNKIEATGKSIFLVNLARENIPAEDDWINFDALEEVTMVGCPRGIFDEANNVPIARRGITATPLGKKYNGANQFVVDMACFPGSSGSPIFVYDRNGYFDRKANSYMMGATRVSFVGVLFAGPVISNNGQIVMGQPKEVQVATMMHLGFAVRSSELIGLEEEILRRAGI